MDGRIKAVFGNMVVAHVDGRVVKNAVGHCLRSDGAKLLCEATIIITSTIDAADVPETRNGNIIPVIVSREVCNLKKTIALYWPV